MTSKETVQLLAIIQMSFPNFKVTDVKVASDVWTMALGEYEYNEVQNALLTYITTEKSGFAPSIGQIIDKIHSNRESAKGEQLTESQAWSLVSKALRNSTYNAKAEFDRLPELVQKAVGSHDMLRVWAVDENYNESVVSSNFMRSYKAVVERKKEYDRLPSNVRELLSIASDGIKSIEG